MNIIDAWVIDGLSRFGFSFAPVPLVISLGFLIINVVIILRVLSANRRKSAPTPPPSLALPAVVAYNLKITDILHWEFEYIRITASEAMRDRHTMVNFYLIIATILAAGVAAVIAPDNGNSAPRAIGTILLWLLCGVGWFIF